MDEIKQTDPKQSDGRGDEDEPDTPEDPQDFSNQFVTITLMFEGSLALIGLVGGAWNGISWGSFVQFRLQPVLLGLGGGLALFLAHLVLLFPGGNKNPFYRYIFKPFKDSLLAKLPEFTWEDIIFIAIMSGIGEEILFRGWIQTKMGIVVASVLFGVIHIWGVEGIGYGLYAIGMGFVLGYLFKYTNNNLWAPVLAHGINNFLGLWTIKKNYLP